MILNFLKVAGRHLAKNKLYLLINTFGMGIAIACAMTAYLLVAYNIEFDAAVDKDQVANVVKLVHDKKDIDGDPYRTLTAPIPLAPAAAGEISGIRHFTRFCSTGGYLNYGDKGFHETLCFADSSFMTMFRPELVSGSYKNFDDRSSIFLSRKFATKYFGNADPVGKTLSVYMNAKPLSFVVGGVWKDMPFNSTFIQNVLMRMETFLDVYNIDENDWSNHDEVSTLFELHDVHQASIIANQMSKYVKLANDSKPDARSVSYELLPFMTALSPNEFRGSDLHLRVPNIALFIFTSMGGIILLIACFNLTNTTLALSMRRLKEIGIRKVVGSGRMQLVAQFLIEITITISIAVVVGFALSLYLIPEFASMWQLPYGLRELNGMNIVIALVTLLFSTAILAGIYPAIFGSRMSPVLLFRGGKKTGGTNFFTRTLVVIQFALSIVVLVSGTMFSRNAAYQDTIGFGYDKDNIITALIQGPREAEALANAISANPKIESSAPSIHHFAFINAPKRSAELNGDKFNATVYDISPEYFSTIGLRIISGSSLNKFDSTLVVVDENFVRRKSLSEPIGVKVKIDDKTYSIAGVVTNHLTDLESNISEDYVYRLAKPADYQILVVRAEAATLNDTKASIDNEWEKLFPGKPLRTDLQSEILYQEANAYNHNLRKIFFFLTILGCLLSVSGLYSMASLNIQKRTKEIGVRKVLGASIPNIIRLINIEFAIILLIAGAVGGLGGYYMTDGLLTSLYEQRIEVTFLPIFLCSLFVVAIGLSATTATIWRTAKENPVGALQQS
jgi:ABC-type antimicrobial peptide transport system permease subunit